MEYKDEFPNSIIVGDPTPGTLNIFRYGAKTAAKLRFYDRNPLCYIMSTQGGIFFGVNLHYHPTTNRMALLKYIDDGGDPSRLRGYHKYIKSYMASPFLQVNMTEWDKALSYNNEEFVRDLGSIELSLDADTVQKRGFYK